METDENMGETDMSELEKAWMGPVTFEFSAAALGDEQMMALVASVEAINGICDAKKAQASIQRTRIGGRPNLCVLVVYEDKETALALMTEGDGSETLEAIRQLTTKI